MCPQDRTAAAFLTWCRCFKHLHWWGGPIGRKKAAVIACSDVASKYPGRGSESVEVARTHARHWNSARYKRARSAHDCHPRQTGCRGCGGGGVEEEKRGRAAKYCWPHPERYCWQRRSRRRHCHCNCNHQARCPTTPAPADRPAHSLDNQPNVWEAVSVIVRARE